MTEQLPIAAQSFSSWLNNAWFELESYFSHLDSTHWAIAATLAIGVGFVCMRGNSVR